MILSKSGSTDYSLLIGSSYEITQSITTSDGKTTTTSQIKQADTKKLAIEHYYTKLNFVLDNNDGSFQPIAGSKHTRYDKSTASIIFGDGEGATITPYTKEFGKSYIGDGKCFSISEITFDDSNGGSSFNTKYTNLDDNSNGNSIDTDVERTLTYNQSKNPWTITIKYNRDIKNWATGSSNTATDKSAVLECVYLGTLNISYKTSSNTSDTYKIKVYYEVRNE